jgi:hypothetical protein
MSPDFTYEFEELEIAPGIMATGEADFVKRNNGSFEMTGLSIYWHPKQERLNINSDNHWLWQSIESALIKYDETTGKLQDAYDKAEEAEREYLRDQYYDDKREERNLGF